MDGQLQSVNLFMRIIKKKFDLPATPLRSTSMVITVDASIRNILIPKSTGNYLTRSLQLLLSRPSSMLNVRRSCGYLEGTQRLLYHLKIIITLIWREMFIEFPLQIANNGVDARN
jgi:hypothetical protein